MGTATPEELFADVTAEVGLDFVRFNGMTGRFYMPENMGAGGALFDYDNDGLTGLYLTRFGANLLLRKNGDGTFLDDVLAGSAVNAEGLAEASMGLDASDIDSDGRLDLLVVNGSSGSGSG